MIRLLFKLALANPMAAAIAGGIFLATILGGLTWGYFHIYNKGVAAERARWDEKVEEAAAKREAERAAAQREQAKLAHEQVLIEDELALEKQRRSDDLARALAHTAGMAACSVLPDAVLQPFRSLGAARKSAIGDD